MTYRPPLVILLQGSQGAFLAVWKNNSQMQDSFHKVPVLIWIVFLQKKNGSSLNMSTWTSLKRLTHTWGHFGSLLKIKSHSSGIFSSDQFLLGSWDVNHWSEHSTLISTEGSDIFTLLAELWHEQLSINFRYAGFKSAEKYCASSTYPHCPQFWDELRSVCPPVKSLNHGAEHEPVSQAQDICWTL